MDKTVQAGKHLMINCLADLKGELNIFAGGSGTGKSLFAEY